MKACHSGALQRRDATAIDLAEREFDYRDMLGAMRKGRQRLIAGGLVVSGQRWHPACAGWLSGWGAISKNLRCHPPSWNSG